MCWFVKILQVQCFNPDHSVWQDLTACYKLIGSDIQAENRHVLIISKTRILWCVVCLDIFAVLCKNKRWISIFGFSLKSPRRRCKVNIFITQAYIFVLDLCHVIHLYFEAFIINILLRLEMSNELYLEMLLPNT